MSKPIAPRGSKRIGWIITLALLASAGVFAARSATTRWHRDPTASAAAARPQTVTTEARARVSKSYAALPLAFEANQGQADADVKYIARGKGYRLYLTRSEAVMTLHRGRLDSEVERMMQDRRLGAAGTKRMLQQRRQRKNQNSSAVLRMHMLGAKSQVNLAASAPQSGKVNYFIGKDPSKWHSNVPLFGRVEYCQIYPGVDLAFHGSGSQLEFDYLVSPGGSAKQIALSFEGAEKIHATEQGDLILSTSAGAVQLTKPVAYQAGDGPRQIVDARFVVEGDRVGFDVGPYDHSRQLVIDPTVTYSTYFGGDFADYGISIAVDGSGDAFVAGATDSDTLPDNSGGTNSGSFDVFVTEVSPVGVLTFTSIFGGSVDDFPGGVAVDSQ